MPKANRNNGRRNPGKRHGDNQPPNNHTEDKKKRSFKKKGDNQSIPVDKRRIQKRDKEIITYVFDTNVLMYDWKALYQCEEHEVYIVNQVWRELDAHKKGKTEQASNVRRITRALDKLVAGKTQAEIQEGILLVPPPEIVNGKPHTGKLFFDFSVPKKLNSSEIELTLDEPDDRILMVCLALKEAGKRVVLITKDGNFRVKAQVAGIEAEDYLTDAIPSMVGEEDVSVGFHTMPNDVWEKCDDIESGSRGGQAEYQITHPTLRKVDRNEFLIFPNKDKGGLELMVVAKKSNNHVRARVLSKYRAMKSYPVDPRNPEQRFALELLMDDSIEGVSIAGLAGSGKTYLTLAAALEQKPKYRRIIIARPTIGSDEEIGFLPGDEKEKMDPWMGGLYDNLESLVGQPEPDTEHEGTTSWLMMKNHHIQVKALTFMKGRSFENTFIIIDEAQDLNPKTLKMIATRVGEGSKIVFLGNVAQIDNNYVTEHTNGLSTFIRSFASSPLTGHVTLQQGVRSRFATEAEKRL